MEDRITSRLMFLYIKNSFGHGLLQREVLRKPWCYPSLLVGFSSVLDLNIFSATSK